MEQERDDHGAMPGSDYFWFNGLEDMHPALDGYLLGAVVDEVSNERVLIH